MLPPQITNPANPHPHNQSQSSIKSFFQPKLPIYSAPPPAQRSEMPRDGTSRPLVPPPPPPAPRQTTPLPPPPKSTPLLSRVTPPDEAVQSQPENTHLVDTCHSQAKISRVEKHHVQPLRRINSLLLPVSYPDNFYNKITDPSTTPNFSRVVLWTDKPSKSHPEPGPLVVGGIVCRLDLDPATQCCEIYIQSLALLSPYRQFGLATALLDEVVRYAVEQKIEPCPITSLYAHVWTNNEEAIKWYGTRGFTQEGGPIQGYYRRLQPDSAIVLRRLIKPSDHLLNITPQQATSASQRSASSTIPDRPNPLQISNRAVSYQQKGPGHEWNDLPSDVLMPSSRNGSTRPSPNASSANLLATEGALIAPTTSTLKAKKKRVYPTAAFGGV